MSIVCISELTKYSRTMQHPCSLTGATQSNVNILEVSIKFSRTSLYDIRTALLEALIVSPSLSLLSATVVNCATSARSASTKASLGAYRQISSITFVDLMKFSSWAWVVILLCQHSCWHCTAGCSRKWLPAERRKRRCQSAVFSAYQLCDPKLCLSSFVCKMGLLLMVPTSQGCCEEKLIHVKQSLAHWSPQIMLTIIIITSVKWGGISEWRTFL